MGCVFMPRSEAWEDRAGIDQTNKRNISWTPCMTRAHLVSSTYSTIDVEERTYYVA